MSAVRWGSVLLFLLVFGGTACTGGAPDRTTPPNRQALDDSIEAGYERLQRMYASADTLPPDVQRMRGAMEQMHGQMRRHQERMGMHGGRGRQGGRGMHEGHGRGRMHDGGHHQRRHRGARRDSAQMWEWHQQMMGMHSQMMQMHEQQGQGRMAERHRRMKRRHRQMMGALPSEDESPSEQQRVPQGEAAIAAEGENLYGQHCASCHGQQGTGLGAFPPLAGSEWVTGDPDTAIRILLHGLQGRIEVDGRSYNNVMPAFGRRLSDEEVAALLSYIRSSWGNETETIRPEEVAEIRRQHSGRARPWTAAQLRDEE